jgi:hypothetical protein
LRRPHRQNRPSGPTGRAAIGRPSRNRRRSSASARASGYRPQGSFSRHFSARERLDQLGGLARRDRALVQPFGKTSTIGQLEREIGPAILLANRMNRDDLRMLEPRDHLGFGQESAKLPRRRECRLVDHLDRHHAVQPVFSRLEDDPHSTPADFAQDFVAFDSVRRVSSNSTPRLFGQSPVNHPLAGGGDGNLVERLQRFVHRELARKRIDPGGKALQILLRQR